MACPSPIVVQLPFFLTFCLFQPLAMIGLSHPSIMSIPTIIFEAFNAQTPPPMQLVCITFTDIIDSTEGWDASEPKMWQSILKHHQILRAQLARFGGFEVKSLGDGFFNAFNTVRQALHFCLAVQEEVVQSQWHRDIIALRATKDAAAGLRPSTRNPRGIIVRMGLHWGLPYQLVIDPAIERPDIYGLFVCTSHRIQDEAAGDEIAVSDAFILELYRVQNRGEILDPTNLTDHVRESVLLKEMSRATFEVRSKGERHLKGVSRPEHITIISNRR